MLIKKNMYVREGPSRKSKIDPLRDKILINLGPFERLFPTRVSYGMSKKLNLPCPIPTCSSPLDRVIYISKDVYLNVEYDVNCFQSELLTQKKILAKFLIL